MKEQAHLIIHGKVQGVFFRDTVCKKAHDLNVSGWVRNNSDGTVEILCQGNSNNVQALIDWCYNGPLLASVTTIDIQKQPLNGEELYDSFDTKY
ncbi:acylphosphatase [bacterium]|nr:acylphosphatase [bacterium]